MILNNNLSIGMISPTTLNNTADSSSTNSQASMPQHEIQNSQPTEEDYPQNEGSCKECLYTGVATCTGVSLYFMKLASEVPEQGTREVIRQATKQKRFLFGGSAVWAAAGVYRMYLG
jgi:hypothetical protein